MVHIDVRILREEDGSGGEDSDGICPECHFLFRATHWLDRPLACACREHACEPPPKQTERYKTDGGVWLCAECYCLGHTPTPPREE